MDTGLGVAAPHNEALDVGQFAADVGPRLVSALTVQVGDRSLAEELTQETLIRCIQHWPKVAAADRPDAWAFRTAFNLAKSKWRRLGLERRVAANEVDRVSQDHGDHPTDREELVMLRQALSELPDRQRAVIVCRHLLGYDVRTTANVLGCADGTVKSHTAQGIERLRTALGEQAPGDEEVER